MKQQFPGVKTSFFTSNIAIGGPGGSPFVYGIEDSQSPTSATVVRSLQAWVNSKFFRGIQVELTDGQTRLFGFAEGTATEKFYLANGEKVTSLKVWGAREYTRNGGFEMKTSNGRIRSTLMHLTSLPKSINRNWALAS